MHRFLTAAWCVAVFLLVLPSGVSAQAPSLSWVRLPGPYGGTAGSVGSQPGGYTAIAVASNGLHWTADGGASWTRTDVATDWISGSLASPDGSFWVYGSLLISTLDLGTVRADNILSPFVDATKGFGIAPANRVVTSGDILVATSMSPYVSSVGVYRSADRGQTWSRIALDFDATGLVDLHADAAGRLFAVPDRRSGHSCAEASVYRSLDSGLTWQPTPLALGSTSTPARLFSGPGDVLWALSGTLYRSFDGVTVSRSDGSGASWTIALGSALGLQTRAVIVAEDGSVVVGARGRGYRSSDSGQSWFEVDFGLAGSSDELDVLVSAPTARSSPASAAVSQL